MGGKRLLAKLSIPYENNYAKNYVYIHRKIWKAFLQNVNTEGTLGAISIQCSVCAQHMGILERRGVAGVLAQAAFLK